MTKTQNEDFDIFVGNLLHAYRQFCYWHHLSKLLPEAKEKGLKGPAFWATVQLSFLKGYLGETAKLFEKQKGRFPEVLSIYYLMDVQFLGHEETIGKLKTLRDKVIYHSEVSPSRNIDDFMSELSLTPKQIQALLVRTIEVVQEIRVHYKIGGDIFYLFTEAEEKARKEILELLDLN